MVSGAKCHVHTTNDDGTVVIKAAEWCLSFGFHAPAAKEEEDQMEDRTQLKIAFKSMRKASKALRRSVKTNEREVERLRLADDFRKKAQGWADLIAKGDTA